MHYFMSSLLISACVLGGSSHRSLYSRPIDRDEGKQHRPNRKQHRHPTTKKNCRGLNQRAAIPSAPSSRPPTAPSSRPPTVSPLTDCWPAVRFLPAALRIPHAPPLPPVLPTAGLASFAGRVHLTGVGGSEGSCVAIP